MKINKYLNHRDHSNDVDVHLVLHPRKATMRIDLLVPQWEMHRNGEVNERRNVQQHDAPAKRRYQKSNVVVMNFSSKVTSTTSATNNNKCSNVDNTHISIADAHPSRVQ